MRPYHFLTVVYWTDDKSYRLVLLTCVSLMTTEEETVLILIGHVLDH